MLYITRPPGGGHSWLKGETKVFGSNKWYNNDDNNNNKIKCNNNNKQDKYTVRLIFIYL